MGTLYKLEFPNGKSYIGITIRSLSARMQDHRKCANNGNKYIVYKAWRKYGDPKIITLAILENTHLPETETRAIRIFNTKYPNGYNRTNGGDGCSGMESSESTRQKLRIANLGRKASVETRTKMSIALTGRKVSAATRTKIGLANAITAKGKSPSIKTREKLRKISTGRTHVVSIEAREKMRCAKLGKTASEETRRRMSAAQKGRTVSAATIEKIRNSNLGKVMSVESREKMRQAKLGTKLSDVTRLRMSIAHKYRHNAAFATGVDTIKWIETVTALGGDAKFTTGLLT